MSRRKNDAKRGMLSMSFTSGFVNFADKMARRSDWVDWRRGMAILFVLLFHYVANHGVWMDVGPSVAPGSLHSHFQRLFPPAGPAWIFSSCFLDS
jgi:uncharacterized membrane protein